MAAVTDENGADYVEPAERVAVFDNDGTLWVEQPMYTQLAFAFDRAKTLAPQLGLFVHHTDADREYAYDRISHVGKLDEALDRADADGWIIVDMKKDWKAVFPDR